MKGLLGFCYLSDKRGRVKRLCWRKSLMLTFALSNLMGPLGKGQEGGKGSGITLKVVYFGGNYCNI